jgi:cyclophilin family peptidyl-prolyl cis-trans isomerase
LLLISVSVGAQNKPSSKKESIKQATTLLMPVERLVLISTEYGDMKIKLYNETPLHRDNFIKLAEQGFYDSLLFHRIIKEFMIQGGDPQSKTAAPGVSLGGGDIGYTIPAEFHDSLFHRKGALCAARTENPEKASSGCQFYIVQGKKLTDADLDRQEQSINQGSRQQMAFLKIITRPENAGLKEQFTRYQQAGQHDSLNELVKTTVMPMINAEMKPFTYSPAQREVYKTDGGTPMLDQNYTVYGEVIEGLDVIDKIAAVQTVPGDRPVQDVRMKVRMLN